MEKTEVRTVRASTGTDGITSSFASVIGVSAWEGDPVAAGAILVYAVRALRKVSMEVRLNSLLNV